MVETNQHNQAAYQTEPKEVVDFVRNLGYVAHSILESGALVPGWPIPGAVEDVLFKIPGL
jgi:hypothetical protein